VTPRGPSQDGRGTVTTWPGAAFRLSWQAMTYAVLLRFDSAGACVNIPREDDEPLMGDGVRYRLVAQTDDHGEAVAVADLLHRRIAVGEDVDTRGAPLVEA
jgi:hypothetical protein